MYPINQIALSSFLLAGPQTRGTVSTSGGIEYADHGFEEKKTLTSGVVVEKEGIACGGGVTRDADKTTRYRKEGKSRVVYDQQHTIITEEEKNYTFNLEAGE